MKKLLAMVLALVMTLSLAVSANAAFKDDTKISDDYAEAVAVLNGMGVFKGYEDGSFKPEGNITRAEVATIIYRIYTADVAKNDKSGLYATYNKFSDMAGAGWAQGYIGYCANASLVKGYPDGTFKPSGKVTGYEVLAMILRAVGYDKNNEFSGADWALHVAQTAQQLGVLDNVAKTTDLNAPASRELVAELLFQGIQKAQVTYTPAFGYVTDKVISTKTNSLGEKNFKLAKKAASDEWGRPATTWTYTTGDTSTTFVSKPDASYTVATTECDIAHDISLKENKEFTLYTNGSVNGSKYVVQPLDTVQKLGAQGTLLEVYKDAKVIVAIDTFLAKVTDVKEATYDPQGHLKAPAMITLTVYSTAAGETVVLTDKDANYGYVKGDYVLVNAYTNNTVNYTSGVVTVNTVKVTSTPVATYGSKNVADYAKIVGKADSIEGAQTFIWYNNLKHTVNGTNYDDAKWFKLDEAGTETTNHTWFFDSYGNLIGAVDIATQYTYGIIENIQWQNPALSNGYAQATIRYIDGTTETKVVTSINGNTLTYANSGSNATRPVSLASGFVSTTMQENAAEFFGTDLYRIETAADGTVALKHVFHTDSNTSYNSQLINATIKGNGTLTALAAITGTPASGDNHSVIYTNSNTTFMVRTGNLTKGFTYTVVKGYENVANYTNATVDYVNLDGDSYADYVYITGDADDASYFGMFYLTSNVAQQYLKANGGTDYYELTGILDGKATTVKLDGEAVFWSETASASVKVATLDKAALQNLLAGYLNKMFTVSVVNDRVMGIWGPKGDVSDLYNIEVHQNKAYENLALDYQAASSTTGTITKNGNVLYVNGVYYNILNNLTATTNGYAWGETEDLSNKNVYVVYDKSLVLNNNTYVAKEVYVADAASSGDDSGVTNPTTTKLTYKIVMVNPTTGAPTGLVYTGTATIASSATAVTVTLTDAANATGVSAANLTAYGPASQHVTANGVAQEVVFTAYYAA